MGAGTRGHLTPARTSSSASSASWRWPSIADGGERYKDTKFINCRIGPFWRAVWLVIWAVRKRIFQLLAGSRDDYQVSSAGGGGDALYLFHSERTPASSVCRIGGPQTRTWRHCLRRSTPQLSSKDH